MRFLSLICAVALLTGCKSANKKEQAKRTPVSRPPVAKTAVDQPKPSVKPVDAVRGRVVSVREELRFLIADFAGAKMPKLDQQLFIYRLDQRVAEIKVSGPYRGTTVAADIVAGDARMGDLVRDR